MRTFYAIITDRGYVGRSLKHSFGDVVERHGVDRAVTVYRDMRAAFDGLFDLVEREQIDCKLVHCGRFVGAQSPAQYERMAREYELRRRHLNARATFAQLLALGAIPVVNENDTIATAEIRP